jgi:hypothetical protein
MYLGGAKMLTEIILLLLALAMVVLVVELSRQLGWLRKTINAALPRRGQEDTDLVDVDRLNSRKVVRSASHLLKEALVETTQHVKHPRKPSGRKNKSRISGPK